MSCLAFAFILVKLCDNLPSLVDRGDDELMRFLIHVDWHQLIESKRCAVAWCSWV
jgi:hypothetical protein